MGELTEQIIVLKFGGSVLTDPERYEQGVHEIYRWRRIGWRVVAVVSALAGETDALIEQADRIAPSCCPRIRAGWLGQGETRSAALLGLMLERSGIPARVLNGVIGINESLESNDPERLRVKTDLIEQGLDSEGVVVIPGYIASDTQGRSVTLGRGGSDTSAVLVAGKLGTERCRLIKDVDGLYVSDPSDHNKSLPLRYHNASYHDALGTDGTIIQHDSVKLAETLGVRIELGRINGIRPSNISADQSVTGDQSDKPSGLRVAICGLGTVGGGVSRSIGLFPELFVPAGGACRLPEKHSDLAELIGPIGDDPIALAQGDADIVVELIGGVDDAYDIVRTALTAGKHVVTANKALIAKHGAELFEVAKTYGVRLLCSASVGGSLPVLERLRSLEAREIVGVLNGTSQCVLNAIARGVAFDDAVLNAQRLGYAEADPSRDLDGRDANDKLRVIAQQLGWEVPVWDEPNCELQRVTQDDGLVRQVARISLDSAQVRLERTEHGSDLAALGDSQNQVTIRCAGERQVRLLGDGAGRWATTVSVIGDLLELSRALSDKQCPVREEVLCGSV